jgi:hypothetical protein
MQTPNMQTRRQFIVKGAPLVVAGSAASAVGPTVFTRHASAASQLKILQWSHFVPAYDQWFDPWAKQWGASKGIEVTVDHVSFADVVPRARTTGAENDIEQATGLVRWMVTRWGMSDRVGMVQLAPRENPYLGGSGGYAGERPFSEMTAEAIDAEVLKIIGESHEEAKRLLSAHRKQLDALADALLSRETLSEREILEVTGLPRAPALQIRNAARS